MPPRKSSPRKPGTERRTWDGLNEGDYTGEEELAADNPPPIHLERQKRPPKARKALPAAKPEGKPRKQGGE